MAKAFKIIKIIKKRVEWNLPVESSLLRRRCVLVEAEEGDPVASDGIAEELAESGQVPLLLHSRADWQRAQARAASRPISVRDDESPRHLLDQLELLRLLGRLALLASRDRQSCDELIPRQLQDVKNILKRDDLAEHEAGSEVDDVGADDGHFLFFLLSLLAKFLE